VRLGNKRQTESEYTGRPSRTGKAYWRNVKVDACIAPIVDALNNAGILTRQSCCGHGKYDGRIDLQDGRVLIIQGKGEIV
jgi:hypothetical protein